MILNCSVTLRTITLLVSVVVDEITALVRQRLLVPIRDLAEKIAIFVIFLKD